MPATPWTELSAPSTAYTMGFPSGTVDDGYALLDMLIPLESATVFADATTSYTELTVAATAYTELTAPAVSWIELTG